MLITRIPAKVSNAHKEKHTAHHNDVLCTGRFRAVFVPTMCFVCARCEALIAVEILPLAIVRNQSRTLGAPGSAWMTAIFGSRGRADHDRAREDDGVSSHFARQQNGGGGKDKLRTCPRSYAISIHGTTTLISSKSIEPRDRSWWTICCTQVVPHFGLVTINTSPDLGLPQRTQ